MGTVAGVGAGYALGEPVLEALGRRPEPRCEPHAPGIPAGAIAIGPGGAAWTTDVRATTITAHRGPGGRRGRSIDVGGAPVGLAISPGGTLALVTTAFYDRPGLALVRLSSGRVSRVDVGPEPRAVAFAPDGESAYVAGGGAKGTLTRVRPGSGRVERTVRIGAHPRSLAITPDGEHALVTLNGDAGLAVVKLRGGMRVRRIRTPDFPAAVAVLGEGRRALVTHNGFEAGAVSVIDLGKGAVERKVSVGPDPCAVAASRSRAVVVTRAGRAVVLDRRGRRLRSLKLGGQPSAVAISGGRALVVDGRTGRLRRIRVGAHT
jgi:DNA-binding beta-propeller fold protein YncE